MNNKIKVLYPITDLSVGGTQQQLLELVKGLDKKRFSPIVVTLISGGALEREFREIEGCRLICLGRKGRFDLSCVFKIFFILRKLKVDVVQPFLTPATLFTLLSALVCRTPVKIVTERGGPNKKKEKLGYCLYLKTEDFLTKFADSVIPNSVAGRDYLLQRGLDESRIKVIYNGISLRRLASNETSIRRVKEKIGVTPGGKIVGMLARLFTVKDPATFLRGAALVSQAMPETKFALVGDGPMRGELETLVRQLDLASKVVFCGEQRDVGDYLSAFDISVLTSNTEGCSNAILEAMALGKPVVCTDVGGNRELVNHGETGLLVPPGDAKALAEAIISLLSNQKILENMATNAKRSFDGRFSMEKMVEQYQALYKEILKMRLKKEMLSGKARERDLRDCGE